jgi:hypothetical protein
MTTALDFLQPNAAAGPAAGPACEAFRVKLGYIWLMILAPMAGLVIGLIAILDQPRLPVLVLAAGLLALGYWAWRRGYQAVRLELRPQVLHMQPLAPGQPAQEIPLASIANYLRPQEAYYQILELQLHGSAPLRLSKRLRPPAAGLLSLDDWTETLISSLEQVRPAVAAPGVAAAPVASGLAAERPRIFARTTFGKVLAGLAGVWLVLAGLARLGGAQMPGAVFLAPALYLGYYFRARGVLKTHTTFVTGIEADREQWRDS